MSAQEGYTSQGTENTAREGPEKERGKERKAVPRNFQTWQRILSCQDIVRGRKAVAEIKFVVQRGRFPGFKNI